MDELFDNVKAGLTKNVEYVGQNRVWQSKSTGRWSAEILTQLGYARIFEGTKAQAVKVAKKGHI